MAAPNHPRGKPKGLRSRKALIFSEVLESGGVDLAKMYITAVEKGELPNSTHPFYDYLVKARKRISGRKHRTNQMSEEDWDRIIFKAEELLICDRLTTFERVKLLIEGLNFIFPKLKSHDHVIAGLDGKEVGVLFMPIPADPKDWEKMAMRQQAKALKAAEEETCAE